MLGDLCRVCTGDSIERDVFASGDLGLANIDTSLFLVGQRVLGLAEPVGVVEQLADGVFIQFVDQVVQIVFGGNQAETPSGIITRSTRGCISRWKWSDRIGR